jgi:predicted protein tyrosine phosphatase
MFIQNASYSAICCGDHWYRDENALLIQITQPEDDFPRPHYRFNKVVQFRFNDVDCSPDDEVRCGAIKDQQAKDIVDALREAYDNKMDVIVHCSAGLCRSGAVVEGGIALGFEDTKKFRLPNLLVKRKLLREISNK